jgi:TM2 domain-containing membrane protein YozV
MNQKLITLLPEVTGEELMYIESITKDMDDTRLQNFALIYKGRRKDPQMILIMTLLGFFVVAGIQRFMLDNIGMGILYIFTAGLCFIGTIVDLINYKKMTLEYNQAKALESLTFVR